jgi:cyanate lyase
MDMNFALKVAIIQKCGNQTVFARQVGLGETIISRIIRGYREASPDEKKIIAETLGLPEEALFPEGK